ncbi:MAG: hypothetical protein DRH32_04285, partial [Deltaproteobacteria bacterium]
MPAHEKIIFRPAAPAPGLRSIVSCSYKDHKKLKGFAFPFSNAHAGMSGINVLCFRRDQAASCLSASQVTFPLEVTGHQARY